MFEGEDAAEGGRPDWCATTGAAGENRRVGGLLTLLGADNSDRLEALERLRRWCTREAGEEREGEGRELVV